jgi:catechol 2,3-dioxygenase-like lactoylglutathione lyase family enzyme
MSAIQITHVDHASVVITDVERSRSFYRDLLGLKEVAKPKTFDFVVLWFDLGDQQLHLLLQPRPDSRSPRHFALRVKDAEAARTYCRAKKVPVEETTPIPGADRFFIYDPDANRIEIIQWLERYDPAISGAPSLDHNTAREMASRVAPAPAR